MDYRSDSSIKLVALPGRETKKGGRRIGSTKVQRKSPNKKQAERLKNSLKRSVQKMSQI